ncbi:MAG: deoxyhypusine synthase family protein [Acidobacteria bacterium]|nr:deoxyhypusine synthase family protein [Acidobacteriota bacterium]
MPRDLSQYRDGVPIESLVGQSGFSVYSYDHEQKKMVLSEVEKVWQTGLQEVWRLRYYWYTGTRKEKRVEGELFATPDHLIMLTNGSYKPLKALKPEESLKAFNSSIQADGCRQIGLAVGKTIPEHRFLLEFKLGRQLAANEVSHHVDGNHLNNTLANLEVLDYRARVAQHRKQDRQKKTEAERQQGREINRRRMTSDIAHKQSRMFWDKLTPEQLEAYRNTKQIATMSAPTEVQPYRRPRAKEWFRQLPKREQAQLRLKIGQKSAEHGGELSAPEGEARGNKVRLGNHSRCKHELDEAQVREALIQSGGRIGRTCRLLKVDRRTLDRRLKMYGITRAEIREHYADNHKVISIEPTGIIIPVYDMTVKRTRNFVANGIVVHNSGATPSEAVSWGKIDPDRLPDAVVCYTDSTIAAPLIAEYALARHQPRTLKRLYERRAAMMQLLRDEHAKAMAEK